MTASSRSGGGSARGGGVGRRLSRRVRIGLLAILGGAVLVLRLSAGDQSRPGSTADSACDVQPAKATTASSQIEGSDVVVADLQSVIRYPTTGNVHSFAIATNACNLGNQRANWISYTNQHPVILQGLFRLKSDRFEQIGMAWVKHGFYAVSDSFCRPCLDPTDGSALGVGCSDPYSASLNGVQSIMSPRYLVNAHTGYFPYPWNGPSPQGQERRLLVKNTDLDPALNPNARYFIEGHYVHPDDCRAGTQDNNASYREVLVSNPAAGQFGLVLSQDWPTQRGRAAVRAWRDADPAVMESDIRVPGEGLMILAAKASPTGTGLYRYNYALQNLNSDRSARSFTVDLPDGAILSNVGFRYVAHHSGEPIADAPWSTTIAANSITWSTVAFEVNQFANALRYDLVFTFFFDANIEPGVNKATIGLFKPGVPSEVAVTTTGPRLELIDCNRNNLADACDLDCESGTCPSPCGFSIDCNANHVPDECEPDCNGNSIADECDISSCPPGELACGDCNGNFVPDGCEPDCDEDGIPDNCDPPEDTDGDGITNCFDLCPDSTPTGVCECPLLGTCCFPVGICISDYPRYACLSQGGTPDCIEAPCRLGCLIGDSDRDGDRDLLDFSAYQNCFSESFDSVYYMPPSEECLSFLDFEEDGDIDLADHGEFANLMSEP